jgi:hypothetical protein
MARMFQVYGIGQALVPVLPPPLAFENPPTTNQTNYEIGQLVYSPPQLPTSFYLYAGGGNWVNATSAFLLATYAQLAAGSAPNANYVSSTNDIHTFVNTYASAGGVPATTSTEGLVFLATNPEALAGTLTTNYAINPGSLAYALANGLAIGGSVPGAGAFTTLSASSTLAVTGATTLSAGLSGTTATFSSTLHATGATTLGSTLGVTGTTTLAALTQLGTASINASGAATTTIGGSSGAVTLVAGAGGLAINGGGNTIDIGTDAANTIVIGDATGAASLSMYVGSGDFLLDGVAASTYAIGPSTTTGTVVIGGTAQSGAITVGSSTAGSNSVLIANGSGSTTVSIANVTTTGATVSIMGAAAIGTASSFSVFSGSTPTAALTANILTGATPAAASVVNIMTGAQSAGTSQFNLFTGNITGGTQTFNLATGTGAATLNIGTGATVVKTINIGGTAANVIAIGNTQTTGSITIGNALTSGTVTVGGTAGTGLISIGNATNATGQTVSINNAASITGASSVNILSGATPGAAMTLNVMTGLSSTAGQANFMTGAYSGGTSTFNVLTGTSTGGTQTINLATGSSPAVVNIGNAAAGAIGITSGGNITQTIASGNTYAVVGGGGTINIGIDAANTIQIGNGAFATTTRIGSTNTTSTTTINGGSGGVNVTGANLQIATAGKFLEIKGASFAATNSIGVGTLSSGTVDINNTNIAAGDVILLTRTGANGSTTLGELTYTISASTKFTVTSLILGTPGSTQTGDTSTFSYIIVRPT